MTIVILKNGNSTYSNGIKVAEFAETARCMAYAKMRKLESDGSGFHYWIEYKA